MKRLFWMSLGFLSANFMRHERLDNSDELKSQAAEAGQLMLRIGMLSLLGVLFLAAGLILATIDIVGNWEQLGSWQLNAIDILCLSIFVIGSLLFYFTCFKKPKFPPSKPKVIQETGFAEIVHNIETVEMQKALFFLLGVLKPALSEHAEASKKLPTA